MSDAVRSKSREFNKFSDEVYIRATIIFIEEIAITENLSMEKKLWKEGALMEILNFHLTKFVGASA